MFSRRTFRRFREGGHPACRAARTVSRPLADHDTAARWQTFGMLVSASNPVLRAASFALARAFVARALPWLLFIAAACWIGPVHAESPYERDQREQLEKYQREHGLSPQVQQAQRWEREWKEQHPGQPVPNAGVLQKLHRDETKANIDAGFARMRAQRQAQLQHEYRMSRDHQAQLLAAQHVAWTPAQWKDWDRRYDQAQQQKAQGYLKAVELSGEMGRQERAREEQEKLWKQR